MELSTLFMMSYGVYAVTTLDKDRPTGCIANSAMQVTSSPPMLAVAVNHDNHTNACIKACGRFALNIIAEASETSVIGGFGFRSGRDCDKFEGVPHTQKNGLPVLDTACGWVICQVQSAVELSTHTVFFAEVKDCGKNFSGTPMTYDYYHRVIKGKSPKNAPTYQPEQPEEIHKAGGAKCTVCGYVYEGDFDALPEDWVCPVCGVGKDRFERLESQTPPDAKRAKCTVCGYVYEGDFNALPEDWVCPVCGVGKDKFEKLEIKQEKAAWVCDMCGCVFETDVNDLPDDWKCPICGMGKEHLSIKQ